MKKFLLITLGILIALPAMSRDFTYTYEGKTLFFTVIDEEAKTCKTTRGDRQLSGSLILPAHPMDGDTEFTLKEIGEGSYHENYSLHDWRYSITSVTIPNTVTSIGKSAFECCHYLTSVTIPNSVSQIGDRAFGECITLKNVYLGNSLISIGHEAFLRCSIEGPLEIPNSVRIIGDSAFRGNKISTLKLGKSVISIGEYAFYGNSTLSDITFNNSLKSIGAFAFGYNTSLTSIELPNSVTTIGESAFHNCNNLTSIVLPNSVTSIGDYAFAIRIPDPNYLIKKISVKYMSKNPITANRNIFYIPDLHNYGPSTLTIPKGSKLKFSETVPWSSAKTIIEEEMVEPDKPVEPTAITLDCMSLVFLKGQTANLNATIAPANTTDKTVIWKSSNYSVVDVDGKGQVTAVSLGEAVITASCGDVTATCTVSVVRPPVESITINQSTASLKVGQTVALSAIVKPDDAEDKTVTWSSSNESIATVDTNGLVTAIGVGEAVITAKCFNVSTTCAVTVVPTPVEGITLDLSNNRLMVGESITLVATVRPEDATDKTVTWTSSNDDVATVDANGTVTGVRGGFTTIIAACGDFSASLIMFIIEPPIESVSISQSEASLHVGDNIVLTAKVFPEVLSYKIVEWSSLNKAVATVDANGKVVALSVGKAEIRATCENVRTSCMVTVIPAPEESITLCQTSASMKVGERLTLTATVLPENATNKTVVWTSSDNTVATVDNNGNVVALAAGETEIIASNGNVSASCMIKVEAVHVERIDLTPQSSRLKVGETIILTAAVSPLYATNKSLNWSSSNTAVATVEQNGKVTAIKPGTANIVVEALDGSNIKAVASIEVYSDVQTKSVANFDFSKPLELSPRQSVNTSNSPVCEVNNVKFVYEEISLTVSGGGTTPRLWYNASQGIHLRIYNGGKIVITASDDYEIESVEFVGQQLDALSIGGASLSNNSTVNYALKTPSKSITIDCVSLGSHKRADISSISVTYRYPGAVVTTPAESVELNKHEFTLFEGATAELVAVVKPEDATSKAVVWSSSDAGVATVDQEGCVTAVAEGVAVIRVEMADDATVYDECLVRVSKQATGIEAITGDIAPYEVYDLSGTRLGDSIKDLKPGFYIIRQGAKAMKLKIEN